MTGKLILTSFGLHHSRGYTQIACNLSLEECCDAKILLIVPPGQDLDLDLGQDLEQELDSWCRILGFAGDKITLFSSEEAEHIRRQYFDVIYVSDGNTFEVLDYIRKNNLVEFIKGCVNEGACYIGAGAGARIAGMDVEAALAVEENRIGMTDFKALGLFHGIALTHFDYDDRVKYEVYVRAVESQKYSYVSTISDEEAEVICKDFHKILEESAEARKRENQELAELKNRLKESLNINPDGKFEVWDVTGEHLVVELLQVAKCEGKEYAIYKMDNKDVSASYIVEDEEGVYLQDLDDPKDKAAITSYAEKRYSWITPERR